MERPPRRDGRHQIGVYPLLWHTNLRAMSIRNSAQRTPYQWAPVPMRSHSIRVMPFAESEYLQSVLLPYEMSSQFIKFDAWFA